MNSSKLIVLNKILRKRGLCTVTELSSRIVPIGIARHTAPPACPVDITTSESKSVASHITKHPERLLIVIVPKTNYTLKKVMKAHDNIQVITYNDLQFFKLDHCLVPDHTILTAHQWAKVNTNELQINNLPKLLVNDAIAQLIGARAGDIVQIKRTCQDNGPSIYYRLVM